MVPWYAFEQHCTVVTLEGIFHHNFAHVLPHHILINLSFSSQNQCNTFFNLLPSRCRHAQFQQKHVISNQNEFHKEAGKKRLTLPNAFALAVESHTLSWGHQVFLRIARRMARHGFDKPTTNRYARHQGTEAWSLWIVFRTIATPPTAVKRIGTRLSTHVLRRTDWHSCAAALQRYKHMKPPVLHQLHLILFPNSMPYIALVESYLLPSRLVLTLFLCFSCRPITCFMLSKHPTDSSLSEGYGSAKDRWGHRSLLQHSQHLSLPYPPSQLLVGRLLRGRECHLALHHDIFTVNLVTLRRTIYSSYWTQNNSHMKLANRSPLNSALLI